MHQPPPPQAQPPRYLELSRYGLTIANGVTAVRLFLVPFIVVALLNARYDQAFWMTLIAGFTDAIDGYLARAFGHKSIVGAYLDPIADKVLIHSLFGILTYQGHIPLWLVLLALGRDVAIVATVAVFTRLAKPGLRMQPLFISKLTTFAQITLVLATMADLAFTFDLPHWRDGLIWGVAAITFASWVAYFVVGLRALKAPADQPAS
jgi:cardiolipin synthase